MMKTVMKYKIIRIRNKISFHAFKNRMTILELIVNKAYLSFKELVKQGEIVPKLSSEETQEVFDDINNGNTKGAF
jgi:hypothetical protein